MLNVHTIGSLRTMIAASCLLFTTAHAQEAYDIRSGGMRASPPSAMLSFGENPGVELPPRPRMAPRPKVHVEASGAYCVRTCDGRYFPAPVGDQQSRAEGCKNLCPAAETKVFSGSSIDSASSKDGRAYSALPNAFRYRKELVAGCTCNGKDVVGLASLKPDQDKTLRRGDMIAKGTGLDVVKRVDDGAVSYTKASVETRSKFERLPVLASD
ncbi:MAG: DUF2865 domain-containing protein [Bradyrhizobium sp.]|nr:DUF2865 domain-containing protein [Bradyrhizobium sp.]